MRTLRRITGQGMLARCGLKKTKVRADLLKALARSDQPVNVPQILGLMPPPTDAVTVYRTLNTFLRKGLVHRIRGEGRSWRYAIGQVHPNHPHFVCQRCGRVECLTRCAVPPSVSRSIEMARGYRVSYPEVVLHGVCPRCR